MTHYLAVLPLQFAATFDRYLLATVYTWVAEIHRPTQHAAVIFVPAVGKVKADVLDVAVHGNKVFSKFFYPMHLMKRVLENNVVGIAAANQLWRNSFSVELLIERLKTL